MKTKTQVLKENSNFKPLINAVIRQLGDIKSLTDIANHGINGGFSGFTYYSDTHQFAIKNNAQIVALLEEEAQQIGMDIIEMVSNFGVFRNCKMDNTDKKHLYKYLSGGKPEQGTITNIMAWFAAEEVARMFNN